MRSSGWRPRIAVVLVVAAMLLCRAKGYAQPTQGEDEAPEPLRVLGSGVGIRGERYLPSLITPTEVDALGVVLLENPNTGFAAEGVRITLYVLDAQGERLFFNDLNVPQVLPNQRQAVSVSERAIETARLPVTETTATVSVLRWRATTAIPALQVRVSLTSLQFHGDTIDPNMRRVASPLVVALVDNPLDAVLGDVRITAVVFDPDGRIVGGGTDGLDQIPPKGGASASVVLVYDSNVSATSQVGGVEVYAAYSWIDLTPYLR